MDAGQTANSGLLRHVVRIHMRWALPLLLADLEASGPAAMTGSGFPQVLGQ